MFTLSAGGQVPLMVRVEGSQQIPAFAQASFQPRAVAAVDQPDHRLGRTTTVTDRPWREAR